MKKIIIYILILIGFSSISNTVYALDPIPTNKPLSTCPEGQILTDEYKCYNPKENYVLLAPIPCEKGTTNCDTNGKMSTYNFNNSNPIGSYLNTMIKIFIGLCGVLAIIMIVMGGLEYMTSELISEKESGKQRITNAVLGLILALGSWALLYTINPDLLNTDSPNLTEAKVTVELDFDQPQTYDPKTGKYPNGTIYGSAWNDSVGHRATLPQYVSVNAAECTSVGQQNCTSTRKLDTSALQTIQYGCKCNLVLSGGTESWLHGGKSGKTRHMLGSSTVDLRKSPELNKYIAGDKPLVQFQRYTNGDGLSYLYEGNHWHVGP